MEIKRELKLVAELQKPAYDQLLADRDYDAIAVILTAPTIIVNPQTEPEQVSKHITLNDIFGAVATVAPADLAKSALIPDWMIDRAELSMQQNDRVAMAHWLVSIGATAQLSPASNAALTALLGMTEVDPAWTATLEQPSIADNEGIGYVTSEDVQEIAHRYFGG